MVRADGPQTPGADVVPPSIHSSRQERPAASADFACSLGIWPLDRLRLHPAAEHAPGMSPDELSDFAERVKVRGIPQPLVVLADGAVLADRDLFLAANAAGLRDAPVRVVTAAEVGDPEDYALFAVLGRLHLSDDRRAVLAVEWQARRTPVLRSAAGRKAAAVRDGRIVSEGGSETIRHDSRVEACGLFRVKQHKLKQVCTLARVAPRLLPRVRAGDLTLLDALREAGRSRKRRERRRRSKGASALPQLESFYPGDCRTVLPTLPPDRFKLLLTDPPWGGNYLQPTRVATEPQAIANDRSPAAALAVFAGMLKEAAAAMEDECVALVFVPWKFEPLFRAALFDGFTATALHGTRKKPSLWLLALRGVAQGVRTARLSRELGVCRPHLLAFRRRVQESAASALGRSPLADAAVKADERYQNAGEKRRAAPRPGRPAAEAGQQAARARHLGHRPPAGAGLGRP